MGHSAGSSALVSTPYAILVDRLLALLGRTALGGGDDERFRTEIEHHRASLGEASDDRQVERHAGVCLQTCEDYLEHARRHLLGCEEELAEVVEVLRLAVTSLSGGRDLDDAITASTDRLSAMAQIEDIRQLKREIRTEVDRIRTAVDHRRRRDDAELSRLTAEVAHLEARLRNAEEEASRDPLTGIANRRSFGQALKDGLRQAQENDGKLVLALFDIDDFKVINDTHGHPVGDRVLACVAELLATGVRPGDLVARIGGEEFAVLLRGLSAGRARERLHEIQEQFGPTFTYEHEGQTIRVGVTLSGGVAVLEKADTADSLIKRADAALYEAKRKGKNRIVTHAPSILRSLLSIGR